MASASRLMFGGHAVEPLKPPPASLTLPRNQSTGAGSQTQGRSTRQRPESSQTLNRNQWQAVHTPSLAPSAYSVEHRSIMPGLELFSLLLAAPTHFHSLARWASLQEAVRHQFQEELVACSDPAAGIVNPHDSVQLPLPLLCFLRLQSDLPAGVRGWWPRAHRAHDDKPRSRSAAFYSSLL